MAKSLSVIQYVILKDWKRVATSKENKVKFAQKVMYETGLQKLSMEFFS